MNLISMNSICKIYPNPHYKDKGGAILSNYVCTEEFAEREILTLSVYTSTNINEGSYM